MADRCPCGALLVLESVTPDLEWWQAVCQAGHTVHMRDLEGPGHIVGDAR